MAGGGDPCVTIALLPGGEQTLSQEWGMFNGTEVRQAGS